MIQIKTAKVYYAPTKGRRYFTKKAAINAEAIAIILKKYPTEDFEPDTGFYVDIRTEYPDRFERMMRSMVYKLKVYK
jgi:hypothetical protein